MTADLKSGGSALLGMKHFHGVATKYLESYLGWMRLLDREKSITAKQLLGIISERKMVYQPLMRT